MFLFLLNGGAEHLFWHRFSRLIPGTVYLLTVDCALTIANNTAIMPRLKIGNIPFAEQRIWQMKKGTSSAPEVFRFFSDRQLLGKKVVPS
ncbi:MAG: hypothetical protein M0042_10645 [Nitrospiraceae bacterium]|nr:hypothetical protein [Nitrospiraceae bacterium]